MRILWLSYYYLPHIGGGTWPNYYFSKLLSEKGHVVDLVTPNVKFGLSIPNDISEKISSDNPTKVYRTPLLLLPTLLGPIFSLLPVFIEGLRRGKNADVIVCQYHPHHFIPIVGIVLGRLLKRPVVARACDIYRNMGSNGGFVGSFVKVFNEFNESNIPRFSLFSVCCSDNRKILLNRRPQCSKNVILLYNGFNAKNFENLPSKAQVRKSLGLLPDDKMIVFVGRFSGDEYGTEVLLKAFSLLVITCPTAVLFLIGDTLSSKLSEAIDTLGLTNSIRVFGAIPQDQVAKFIVGADVCIGPLMPTHAIPLKVIEYIACNKPVVTGKGSVSEDLADEKRIVAINPTPHEIFAAISKALLTEESQNEAISIYVLERFSWQSLSIELERILVNAVKCYKNGFNV